jgi:GNAT superfamily N-acetyltransferase
MIRQAAPDDLEPLVRMARCFTEESGLPFTFNEARARKTVWACIHSEDIDFPVCVDDDSGLLAGALIVMYDSAYYDETAAFVDKFFVHKEFRGLGVSRELMDAVDKLCRARGASLIFASATAGMGERVEKLYVRLFERHGFRVFGRIIMRIIA